MTKSIKVLVDSGRADLALAAIREEKEALQAFFQGRGTMSSVALTAMLEAIAEHAATRDAEEADRILAVVERFMQQVREMTRREVST